jgi:transcriptional regulator with XRE-family HTH domain
MSTNIFNALPHSCNEAYVKETFVDMQQESLADYVRRIRVQVRKFSLTDVERNSGGTIDASYVNRIENGVVVNVTKDKLSALARGLQVSEDELFAVARGMSRVGELSLDEARILDFYRALPPDRKDDAVAHLELQYKRHGRDRHSGDPNTDTGNPSHATVKRPPIAEVAMTHDQYRRQQEEAAEGHEESAAQPPKKNSGHKR